jgi:hypothetical protein
MTLVELTIASAISLIVAVGVAGLALTSGRMDKATFYQQYFVGQSSHVAEAINMQIRQAKIVTTNNTTWLTVSTNGGLYNLVSFTRIDGVACVFWLYPGADGNLLTGADNELRFSTDAASYTTDYATVAKWIVPTDGWGGFGSPAATSTTLTVGMRAGDQVDASSVDASAAKTGIGQQGVDINLIVAPRMLWTEDR